MAGNDDASPIVSGVIHVMGLTPDVALTSPPTVHLDKPSGKDKPQNVAIYASDGRSTKGQESSPDGLLIPAHTWYSVAQDDSGNLTCVVRTPKTHSGLLRAMRTVSTALCRRTEAKGGILLHGALVERSGQGIILAGRAGVGKTTASRRIPPPWRSLSDDATLVVVDAQGTYWAHPWPTWARLIDPDVRLSWDVQRALPVKAVCFLAQAPTDAMQTLPPAHATCLLVQSAGQVPSSMWLLERPDQVRLTGAFWELLEEVVA